MDDLQLIKILNEQIRLNENIDKNLKALINFNRLQKLFILSCGIGYKKTASWLYELSKTDGNTKININAVNNRAFRWSCFYGHTETAVWLYESSETYCNKKINIYFYYAAFVWSCYFCMEFVIMEIKKGIVVI